MENEVEDEYTPDPECLDGTCQHISCDLGRRMDAAMEAMDD